MALVETLPAGRPIVGIGAVPVGIGRWVGLLLLLLLSRVGGVRVLLLSWGCLLPVEVRRRRRVITVGSLLVVFPVGGLLRPSCPRPWRWGPVARVVSLGVLRVHLVGVGSPARAPVGSIGWWCRASLHSFHPIPSAKVGRKGREGWHSRVLLLLLLVHVLLLLVMMRWWLLALGELMVKVKLCLLT